MPIRPFKVLLALLCGLLASMAQGSVVYTWHGDCVDRYLSNPNSPDIGGCAALNGIVSGAIGVPDVYVLGTSYAFTDQDGPAGPPSPSFTLDDPFLPISTEMSFGSGGIDFSIISGIPIGHWSWIASNLSSIGGTGDMYFNIDYDTMSIFHVAATNVVFDSIVAPCRVGPGAVCPTPGTLPLMLLGLLALRRRYQGGRRVETSKCLHDALRARP